MKSFPTVPPEVWNFTANWKPWQRTLICPLLVSPVMYFFTLLLSCLATNSYWYLFKLDTSFYLQCSFFLVIGVTLINRFWVKIGLVWVLFFLILTLSLTVGIDWKGRVITMVQNPIALLLLMSVLGPVSSITETGRGRDSSVP
ncbi:MAG: hypothetical protein WCK51_03270 [Armatimonadota bacterium]